MRLIDADKTCKTCADNDDGLCDGLGILAEDDDTYEKHRDCNGCFGASFGDCQRCQEVNEVYEVKCSKHCGRGRHRREGTDNED